MAGVLQHLRSSTLDKRPNPASMVDGQVAINYASGAPGMFFKDSNGSLVKVGPVHVGTTAPNVSPASGGTAGNSRGEQWLDTTGGTYVFKIWDGSAWRSESGTFVDTSGDTMTGALGIIAGSASTPGLFFSGDANSGLYSPGADQVAISTAGSGRLFVDASGNVGVGGTPGVYTKLAVNGNIYGADGSQFGWVTAFANAPTDFIDGSQSSNYIRFFTNNNERLRITSAGLVGVGTSSPAKSFVISSGGAAGMEVGVASGSAAGGTFIEHYNRSSSTYVQCRTIASDFLFQVSGTDALAINSSGRLGVGTTTPSELLELSATADPKIHFVDVGNTTAKIGIVGSTALGFEMAGSERMRIDSSGRVGIGTSSPQASIDIAHASAGANNGLLFTAPGVGGANNGSLIGLRQAANTTITSSIGLFWNNLADNGNSYLSFSTGTTAAPNTERMRITAGGNVGIGTTSASSRLHVLNPSGGTGTTEVSTIERDNSGYFLKLYRNAGGGNVGGVIGADSVGTYYTGGHDTRDMLYIDRVNENIQFYTANTERFRCDSSGRLLVGTSSAVGNVARYGADATPTTQFQTSTESWSNGVSVINYSGSGFAPVLSFSLSASNTPGTNALVSSGHRLGVITFNGNDGTNFEEGARIEAFVDGTPGANDMPGRLVLSTTPDGDSSPDKRMQIDSGSNTIFYGTSEIETARFTGNRNLLIGGTLNPTNATNSIGIVNGTAPSASIADGVVLYAQDVSASSELKVRDEAGNVTTLSPHNFDLIPDGPSEDMAWSYYSERDGKRINVDMLKAIRLLEQISGEKLVYSS